MTVAPGSTAISSRFAGLKQQGRCALMPFLTAGDPDLATTRAALLALQANGADLVELGIPYSDPLADGPVIQAAASRGFTYMVSVTGVTGERAQMESRVAGLVGQLKAMGPTPVAVGFGISGPQQAIEVRSWGADGAIVGSALVKRMAQAKAEGGDPVATAGAFCAELRAALDS